MAAMTDGAGGRNSAKPRLGKASPDGRRRIVYVLGTTRSGTSALRLALFQTRYKGFGESHMDPLLTRIAQVVQVHQDKAPPIANGRSTFDPEVLQTYLIGGYEAYLGDYFQSDYLLDKTPSRSVIEAAPLLNRLHGQPYFLFCARRHVDNVLSKLKKFKNLSFETCCREWVRCNEAWQDSRTRLDGNFLEFDYSDLVSVPETISVQIAEYLQIDDLDERAAMAAALIGERPQGAPGRDLTRFRKLSETGWDAAQQETFLEICGPLGDAMGYGLESYFKDEAEAQRRADARAAAQVRAQARTQALADQAAAGHVDMLAAFGLEIQPGRFPDPALALSEAGPTRIVAAIEAAVAASEHEMAEIARRPALRRDCLAAAIIALSRAGHLAECAHLMVAARLRHRRAAVVAARAMEELRAHDALTAYLAEQEADPKLHVTNRRTFLDIRMHKWLGITSADHQVFVQGPVPERLEDALTQLPAPGPNWVMPHMVRALVQLRGLDGPGQEDAAEAFRNDLLWGRAAQDYFMFLSYYINPIAKAQPKGEGGAGDDARIRALGKQVGEILIMPDPNPLMAAAQAGRNVMLLSAHAGLPHYATRIMFPTGLPHMGVTAAAPTNLTDPMDKNIGVHGNYHANLLKAVKILRREPHIIQMMPDGALGGEPVMKELMGRPLPLGPGAEMIAWQSQAAVFFFSTRWRDGRPEIYVRTGPVAEKTGTRDAFSTAFYDFYLGCLEGIVQGNPRDMAPGGGFWNALMDRPK